ncbi:ABC transporter permease [Actinokineospora xionganensis]|uniref:ABC transporter permease n=1 Tax=Actinokineospora xionganensis TaxID=2684470 RepID=A0ABR7KZQ0_9PSEU|nr:ABC transporter permease [Actinokineospora xionganensis]MBC6445845.1 ABC transporter permease [Actinokineospora xionganensis]
MHPALTIAGKDLRQRLRDKSAIVLGLLAPLAIAALMSFAFGSAQTFHLDTAIVDEDHGELAAAFTSMLSSDDLSDLVTLVPATSRADAESKLDNGEVAAVFVIPAGFTAAAHGGGAVPVTVLGTVDQPVATQVGTAIANAFVARFNAVRLSVGVAVAGRTPPSDALVADAARAALPEQVVARSAGTRPLDAISYYGPGMGIFFTMFATGFTARGYFAERANGTLDRITAAPVGPGTVLAGKSLATFGYALASLTTMAVVTTLVFDAYWGPPAAAGALIIAISLALVGLTALVIAISRTERQADGLAGIATFALVLLGGNFVSLSMAPAALRTLALFTPNGWAMRGFTDLSTGAEASAIVLPLAAMLGFTAATTAIAMFLIRRTVTR